MPDHDDERSLPASTERLRFRWWEPDDEELAVALWGDPRVTALIDARDSLTREMVVEMLADQIRTADEHGMQYWPVFSRETGVHVGCAGLRPYARDRALLEIGVHLRHEHWRLGLASEAAEAVMRHAFEERGVGGLFAGHHPDNRASERLLRSLGFARTGVELYEPTGRMHPSYVMTAGSWRRAPR